MCVLWFMKWCITCATCICFLATITCATCICFLATITCATCTCFLGTITCATCTCFVATITCATCTCFLATITCATRTCFLSWRSFCADLAKNAAYAACRNFRKAPTQKKPRVKLLDIIQWFSHWQTRSGIGLLVVLLHWNLPMRFCPWEYCHGRY